MTWLHSAGEDAAPARVIVFAASEAAAREAAAPLRAALWGDHTLSVLLPGGEEPIQARVLWAVCRVAEGSVLQGSSGPCAAALRQGAHLGAHGSPSTGLLRAQSAGFPGAFAAAQAGAHGSHSAGSLRAHYCKVSGAVGCCYLAARMVAHCRVAKG